MGATVRLDYDDPLRLEFEAKVEALIDQGEHKAVVLDQSAFYPESGGQMGDAGQLDLGAARVRVVDTQLDDDGRVLHLLGPLEPEDSGDTAALPEPGTSVTGLIDRARRRSHMALHTGQHMLSRALLTELGGQTVSSRLGETDCNIDLDLAKLPEGGLARAEDVVNAIVDDDVEVRAFFPTPEELAAMDLRRAPKVQENIRIVEVAGFDHTPCGGTHVLRTAQIGLVRVLRTERVKGRIRVLFTAGPRARRHLFVEQDALSRLAQSFTCGPLEIEAAVVRLREERKELKKLLGVTRSRLAEATAAELLSQAEGDASSSVIASFDDADAAFLKVVGERLTRGGRTALLAAPSDDGTFVFLARPEQETDLDCGAILKAAAAQAGGKGGGKPGLAQGRLPGRVDWPSLVAEVLAQR